MRLLESRMIRRISRPKGDKRGGSRKMHNEEHIIFHSSPNIIRIIKSRRMK
jgi:hypothetical protein